MDALQGRVGRSLRYSSFAVDARPSDGSRTAIENADDVSDDELLAAIPEGERLPLDEALAQLDDFLGSAEFRTTHPSWPLDPRAQYLRILRDYEHARTSMAIGGPSHPPLVTAIRAADSCTCAARS